MINVIDLTYRIGDFWLRDMSLEIGDGEYFVLLGKPGSGKSVFLECLCGLNRIAAGTIKIAGKDVTSAEPRDRGIGYVPQDYALFDKSVRGNIEFGLHVQAFPRSDIESYLHNIAELLNIMHLLDRSIHGLSGGEQQKVALARALIIQPKVLLLDEPVSALDEATRETVCMELKRIQRETGTTTIHVSHNLEETRIVADRVGILRAGQLVQIDRPDEIFNHPADADAANFLRVGNVLKGYAEISGEHTRITIGNTALMADSTTFESPREVEFVLPVKDVFVSLGPSHNDFENHLTGNVIGTIPRGQVMHIAVEVGPNLTLTALVPPAFGKIASGTKVHLSFPASAVHIFDRSIGL